MKPFGLEREIVTIVGGFWTALALARASDLIASVPERHTRWVTPLEMRILADTGTHLAHSPVATMKMATGILPLPDVLAAGVNVSLGTDGALNNNTHDMFGEMKAACLLQNAIRRSASAMTAPQALELATIAGAKAIGRSHELGSIEPGKLADIVLIDLNRAHSVPVHNVISNLVFTANPSNVDTVIVGGRIVLRNGTLQGVDEAATVERARIRAAEIRVGMGLSDLQSYRVGDLVVEASLHETSDPRDPADPKHEIRFGAREFDAAQRDRDN